MKSSRISSFPTQEIKIQVSKHQLPQLRITSFTGLTTVNVVKKAKRAFYCQTPEYKRWNIYMMEWQTISYMHKLLCGDLENESFFKM